MWIVQKKIVCVSGFRADALNSLSSKSSSYRWERDSYGRTYELKDSDSESEDSINKFYILQKPTWTIYKMDTSILPHIIHTHIDISKSMTICIIEKEEEDNMTMRTIWTIWSLLSVL